MLGLGVRTHPAFEHPAGLDPRSERPSSLEPGAQESPLGRSFEARNPWNRLSPVDSMLSQKNLDIPATPKPKWLRVQAPGGENYVAIKEVLRQRKLFTVCEEARCPNVGECWRGGTATFMLLGDTCTRACGFCAVKTGNPRGRVDADEPAKIAEAVAAMKLRYVVLTTVDRDDLPDSGAAHFAQTIHSIRDLDRSILIETLTGDFRGDAGSLAVMLAAKPDVFAHNIETVERLTPRVRDKRAGYARSLAVLAEAKRQAGARFTKSSVQVGHGETEAEVIATMRDLRAAGVELLTLGQYLRPTPKHLPVIEYVTPEQFARYRDLGLELGFQHVASGPLVRSSYRAGEHFVESALRPAADAAPGPEPERDAR